MDERFREGIRDFNDEKFFEAHEVLEDLWHEYRETDRTFILGLIQLAAGFYHVQCENYRGAVSQLTKGTKKLEPYAPLYLQIDVRRLQQEVGTWVAKVDAAQLEKVSLSGFLAFPKIDGKEFAPAHQEFVSNKEK